MKHFLVLKSDNLKDIISHYSQLIVIFGSKYCQACRHLLTKELEPMAQKWRDYTFIYVDSERDDGSYIYPTSMSLLSKEPSYWPFFVMFKDGKEVSLEYLTWGKDVDDWIEQLE